MNYGKMLGLLGGTFDPIHVGHFHAAEAARAALNLNRVQLIPSGKPPHRKHGAVANADHRLAMVRLAIQKHESYEVSEAETCRVGHSYTADTLRELHAEGWAPTQLFFILGLDAFADIATWREFPAVLDSAHFVVISRHGATENEILERLPIVQRRLRSPKEISDPALGTAIVPVKAWTRDVSSSGIRARLAHQQPIDGLVPPPVARYILEHHLYGKVGELNDEDGHD
jgi:nicotinate-nucleotide adenylyltransferase